MAPAKISRSEIGHFLNRAVKKAERGISRGHGGPFGAVIVRNGKIIAEACNTVLKNQDPTQHAEINAIRSAVKTTGTFSLEDCDIFSTTEPCPMCFSALHWARIRRVVYSTTIADVHRLGFNELTVSNRQMKKWGGSPLKLSRIKNDACRRLLAKWKRLSHKNTY